MLKKTILVVVLLMLPVLVAAGQNKGNDKNDQYKFIKGKGVALCEAYYKNLILFDSSNVACEREFDPEFKDFKKPEWVEWDITENKDLTVKIKKFLHYGDQLVMIPDLDNEKLLAKDLKDDPYFIGDRMHFSKIDINNDGKLENVILYNEGRCMDMHVFDQLLIVLNEGKNLVDVEKTDTILRSPPYLKIIKGKIAGYNYNLYDIFSYKGKTYFDRWDGVGAFCNDTLSVYELSHGITKELCKYKCLYRCK